MELPAEPRIRDRARSGARPLLSGRVAAALEKGATRSLPPPRGRAQAEHTAPQGAERCHKQGTPPEMQSAKDHLAQPCLS